MLKLKLRNFIPFIKVNQTPLSKNATKGCQFACDVFEKSMDVGSKCEYPLNVLSNFTQTNFKFQGVQINSMEGFLQSLKTPNLAKQKEICALVGIDAKKAGVQLKETGVFDGVTLYWKDKVFGRNSKHYQKLLKKVFKAKYDADNTFRNALSLTSGRKLTHSIGSSNPNETVLTEAEFINLLTDLRDKKSIIKCKK